MFLRSSLFIFRYIYFGIIFRYFKEIFPNFGGLFFCFEKNSVFFKIVYIFNIYYLKNIIKLEKNNTYRIHLFLYILYYFNCLLFVILIEFFHEQNNERKIHSFFLLIIVL